MISSLHSGSSAMKAYSSMMDVTGNNVANVNTREYRAKAASFAETNPSGTKLSSVRTSDTPAIVREYSDGSREKMSNVSLVTEKSHEIVAHRSYEASARTIQTVDQMLGVIINMKA